jgi:hypothetical protein
MEKKKLQRLIKAHRCQNRAAQRRIEAHVGANATEAQKAHFIDAITSPQS